MKRKKTDNDHDTIVKIVLVFAVAIMAAMLFVAYLIAEDFINFIT